MKSNIVCKHISMILLGAILIFQLSSCGSNGESVSGAAESFSTIGQDDDRQSLGASSMSNISSNEGNENPPPSPETDNVQMEEPASGSSEQSNISFNEENDESPLSLEESFIAILLDNGDFIDAGSKNKKLLNLEIIKEAVTSSEEVTAHVTNFAIVDLDGDGENEIILWIVTGDSPAGSGHDAGFEILHYNDGAVYGYMLYYRQFYQLKTDGTFTASGGAGNTAIEKLSFTEDGYIKDTLYEISSYYDSNNERKVQYYANGEISSEEEFDNALKRQEEKTDVGWYELTAENVNIAFENRF